jgi:hypothetical protein
MAATGVAAITAAGLGFCRQHLGPATRLALLAVGAFCLLSILPGDLVFGLRLIAALAVLLWMSGKLARRGARAVVPATASDRPAR